MRLRSRPQALLIDFDDVIRVFDPARKSKIEARYGLAPGALWETAFDGERVHRAVTGQITHAEWMAEVAAVIGSEAAVREWETDRGEVDREVLAVVRDVRSAGFKVALGSNATDRLDEDLALHGLVDDFDVVVRSPVIGFAKPHPRFFEAASEALDTPASEVLFVDDSPRYIAGARAAGLAALRYTGHADLAYVKAAFEL